MAKAMGYTPDGAEEVDIADTESMEALGLELDMAQVIQQKAENLMNEMKGISIEGPLGDPGHHGPVFPDSSVPNDWSGNVLKDNPETVTYLQLEGKAIKLHFGQHESYWNFSKGG